MFLNNVYSLVLPSLTAPCNEPGLAPAFLQQSGHTDILCIDDNILASGQPTFWLGSCAVAGRARDQSPHWKMEKCYG